MIEISVPPREEKHILNLTTPLTLARRLRIEDRLFDSGFLGFHRSFLNCNCGNTTVKQRGSFPYINHISLPPISNSRNVTVKMNFPGEYHKIRKNAMLRVESTRISFPPQFPTNKAIQNQEGYQKPLPEFN